MNKSTFQALLVRDLRVLAKNYPDFILRIGVNPIFLAFVFGFVLPKTGGIPESFANIIFPGILGLSIMSAGVQGTAIPLAWDFGATREIDDRLMAPIDPVWVLVEKIIFGAFQSLAAGIIVFPVAYLLMKDNLSLELTSLPLLIIVILLSSFISATLGMVMGTVFEPMRFAIMFATIIIPMIFLGATYYPWAALSDIPWLKWAILVNPLLYINEAYRAILTPFVPHMNIFFSMSGLIVSLVILLYVAKIGFDKRAFS